MSELLYFFPERGHAPVEKHTTIGARINALLQGVMPSDPEAHVLWRSGLVHPTRIASIRIRAAALLYRLSEHVTNDFEKHAFMEVIGCLVSFANGRRRESNLRTEYDFFVVEMFRRFGSFSLDDLGHVFLCCLMRETESLFDPLKIDGEETKLADLEKLRRDGMQPPPREQQDYADGAASYRILAQIVGYSAAPPSRDAARLDRDLLPNLIYVPDGGEAYAEGSRFISAYSPSNELIRKFLELFAFNLSSKGCIADRLKTHFYEHRANLRRAVDESTELHRTEEKKIGDAPPQENINAQLRAMREPVANLIIDSHKLISALQTYGKRIAEERATLEDRRETLRRQGEALGIVPAAEPQLKNLEITARNVRYVLETAEKVRDIMFPFFSSREVRVVEEVLDMAYLASTWTTFQNRITAWFKDPELLKVLKKWLISLMSVRMPDIKEITKLWRTPRGQRYEPALEQESAGFLEKLFNVPNDLARKMEFVKSIRRMALQAQDYVLLDSVNEFLSPDLIDVIRPISQLLKPEERHALQEALDTYQETGGDVARNRVLAYVYNKAVANPHLPESSLILTSVHKKLLPNLKELIDAEPTLVTQNNFQELLNTPEEVRITKLPVEKFPEEPRIIIPAFKARIPSPEARRFLEVLRPLAEKLPKDVFRQIVLRATEEAREPKQQLTKIATAIVAWQPQHPLAERLNTEFR